MIIKLVSIFCLFVLFALNQAAADETTLYIGSKSDFSIRAGAGKDFPVIRSDIASGTLVKSSSFREEKAWIEVIMEDGNSGWIERKHLTTEQPASTKLKLALRQTEVLNDENDKLRRQVSSLTRERRNLSKIIASSKDELLKVSTELAQLRQLSKNTVSIENFNNELMQQKENLLAKLATLESENDRLNGKLRSRAFIQGALAVLLGVMICIMVPKLMPSSRQKSGWV